MSGDNDVKSGTGSGGAEPSDSQGGIDINALAQKVYRLMRDELRLDRARDGRRFDGRK